MGGVNQATCPPPATKSKVTSKKGLPSSKFGNIRFHEDTPNGEVHFHDDAVGLKCAVDSAEFTKQYDAWRTTLSGEPLVLHGHDDQDGHSAVEFHTYFSDKEELEIGIIVRQASVGQTIKDLDKLAGI